MAIKRVIYELDDSTDLNPTTGATIQNLSPDKDFLSNQTKSLEAYKDSEISKSDKIDNLKPLIGRTIPDLVLEFKNDNRLMTLLITVISFLIFVTKLDSINNFQYPIVLSIILNFLWYTIPFIEKLFKKS
jgi:hypothetical protein